jgi:hypothetical protein
MSSKTRSILLLILIFLFFSLIYQYFVKKDMTDFGVCYKGGKRILKGEATAIFSISILLRRLCFFLYLLYYPMS